MTTVTVLNADTPYLVIQGLNDGVGEVFLDLRQHPDLISKPIFRQYLCLDVDGDVFRMGIFRSSMNTVKLPQFSYEGVDFICVFSNSRTAVVVPIKDIILNDDMIAGVVLQLEDNPIQLWDAVVDQQMVADITATYP